MKIAAGVLFIITAVLDLFAGLGYLLGGALTTGAATIGSDFASGDAELTNVVNQGFLAGGGLVAYGIFILVVTGLLIAAAVFLFKSIKPKFIIVAGSLAILIELVGIFGIHFGITNLIGLVAGVFGIVAAVSISKALNSPAE